MKLYKDQSIQALLGKLLSGEVSELEPLYKPGIGYSYPLVEAILGGGSSEVEGFLNKLYEAGILERRLVDKVSFCPRCDSTNVSVRYCCPYCKSFDIRRSSLIEHVRCGYMDVEENFGKSGKLVCQKCRNELKELDVDYRRAGIWCTCRSCSKSFDIPITSLLCRSCGGGFTFEDIAIKDVYSYALNNEARQEAAGSWVLIAPIMDFLIERGFEVEGPAFLKGKSGANHMFDIIARKGTAKKEITVVDLATSTESEVSEQPVIALFAKIFDVSPNYAYLIAIPKMNDNGKKMAELYNIRVVDARNPNEAIKALKAKI